MPELPEVETVRRGVAETALNKTISHVRVNRYDLRIPVPDDLGQRLSNACIQSIERRGKYMIFHFVQEVPPLIVHLGMSGRIHLFADEADYSARKHDHVVVYFKEGGCFSFEDPRRFGMFYFAQSFNWQNEKPFSKMGPEPLSDDWTPAGFAIDLSKRKGPIKTVLLDQAVVSGLGNIYVCEALHRSRISPLRAANALKKAEVSILLAHVQDVLKEAIESGGSSLKDYRQADGSLGYFQHNFRVYDQGGGDCCNVDCSGQIKRIIQAGRSTFYCPSCQK